MVEQLKNIYDILREQVDVTFVRSAMDSIDPEQYGPQILIGERGVGKTTLLLQKLRMVGDQYVTFYLSADNPLIKALPLFELVYDLYMQYGVRYLVIDEIQKADDWTNHLKAIVDSFPDLLLVASGSSALDLYKGTADLQRRVHGVMLYPLSFVEYMRFTKGIELPSISFEQLLSDHQAIAFQHSHDVDMGDVQAYLSHGLYPYFALRKPIYHSLLLQNIKKTILEDIPTFMNIQTKSLAKIEKLFYFIANIPPSDLSYHALSKKIGISNDLLETIVYYLDQIGVINLAIRSNKTSDIMRKEFKIFLGNPNIVAAYQDQNNRGSVRESFILHVLKKINRSQKLNTDVLLPRQGDILFRYQHKHYVFEIGGKNKTNKQIAGQENAYLIKDDMLIGDAKTIPLWMWGLVGE